MDLDLERVNTATRFSDLYPLFKTISARITNFANIFDFNTAAGIGVVAVGSVWIANQQYLSTPQGTVDASLLTDRKKVLVIGNSIPGYSKLVQNNATNYYWEADGFISWLRAFTKNGFDLVRTAVTTFPTLNAHTGTIDRLGVYSCPGGVALNMLSDIAQIADCCIDQPNVIYLCNIFENDIGNTPLSTLQLQANQIILAVRGKFPKAVIILSQPSPSNSYSAGSVADYVALKAYIAALINSYPNLVTETNSATTTAILRPIASYTTDGIHPTERGALVRARAAFAELGFMFQPLSVPEQEVGNYTVNPTLSLTGNGVSTGTNFNPALPGWQASVNTGWGDGSGAQNIVVDANGGIDLTIQRNGVVSTESVFSVLWTWQNLVTIAALDLGAEFQLETHIKIVNPANLFGFTASLSVVDSSNLNVCNYSYMQIQSAFYTAYPQGLSDLLQAGDEFVFVTPPIPVPDNAAKIYQQFYPLAVKAMATGAATANNNPTINFRKSNITKRKRLAKPVETVTVGASPFTWINQDPYTQDIIVNGGTVSAIAFKRNGVSTVTGQIAGIFRIDPGDALTVTYTVAPTVTEIPRI